MPRDAGGPPGGDAGVVELVAGCAGEVGFPVLFGFAAVDQGAGGAEESAGGAGEPPVVPVDQVVAGLVGAVVGGPPGGPQCGEFVDGAGEGAEQFDDACQVLLE